MKILIVGGAVRDMLLDKKPHDFDYVVQGATLEQFKASYPDALQVGKHFPVFLVGGEEYAFARTEQSTGHGHTNFSVNTELVSLDDDLMRRDLTINALAMCPESSEIYGSQQGVEDANNRILRHVSDAFREDPLRVFRVARLASQLSGFVVAKETIELMRSMAKELESLPAERVFVELRKALESPAPHRFFEVLQESGTLDFWFPEVANLAGVPAGKDEGKHAGERDTFHHTMLVLQRVDSSDPCLRFAALCHDLGKALSENPPFHPGHDKAGTALVTSLCVRLNVPTKYRESAELFCAEHIRMHKIEEMSAGKAVDLLLRARRMKSGIAGFLACSIGDGMPSAQRDRIVERANVMLSSRLPEEFRDRGKACGEILHQLRCKSWNGAV